MTSPVHMPGNNKEFWIRERCYIREIVNSAEIREFSLAEARVEPGVTTELHKLGVKEWYIMLRGTGLVEIDGRPGQQVTPGNVIEIAAGVSQRITNTGNTDLVFQCVCIPRFTPDCYESLEKDS